MPARVGTIDDVAGPVREGSTCPNKSYELPLRRAEVPWFSWKERLVSVSIRAQLRRWLRAQLTEYSRWLGGSSCPVGDSIPRLVG